MNLAQISSNHGNPTAAREVKTVVDNLLFSVVVGIVSSLVTAWLYDMIRHSGKKLNLRSVRPHQPKG